MGEHQRQQQAGGHDLARAVDSDGVWRATNRGNPGFLTRAIASYDTIEEQTYLPTDLGGERMRLALLKQPFKQLCLARLRGHSTDRLAAIKRKVSVRTSLFRTDS